MKAIRTARKVHATTVRLPSGLYEQAQKVVQSGEAASVNDFIVKAMVYKLKTLKRQQIDAQFAQMSSDANYRQESQLILEEFEGSDSEMLGALDK